MGFTRIDLDVANPADPSKRRSVNLLVDTGALITVIPRRLLEELGIPPHGERRFRGFGGVIRRQIGGALFWYQGDFTAAPVAFGEEGDTPVLGVTALEGLGYEVDPVNERLVRVESLLL